MSETDEQPDEHMNTTNPVVVDPAIIQAAVAAAMSALNIQGNVSTKPPGNVVKPPGYLDISLNAKSEEFNIWVQQWDNYSIASSLNKQSNEMEKATFLTIIGPDALKVYNTFEFGDDMHSVKDILKKFESYLRGQVNETFERYKFNSTTQSPGQSLFPIYT